jgi:hypothetical protein
VSRQVRRTQIVEDLLDTIVRWARVVDAVQQTQFASGTNYCREHFSLANPLHLAIMGRQRSKGCDAGFHRDFDITCVKL